MPRKAGRAQIARNSEDGRWYYVTENGEPHGPYMHRRDAQDAAKKNRDVVVVVDEAEEVIEHALPVVEEAVEDAGDE